MRHFMQFIHLKHQPQLEELHLYNWVIEVTSLLCNTNYEWDDNDDKN